VRLRARLAALTLGACAIALAGCQREARAPELRFWTDHFEFRVSSEPVPPRARERVLYKVVVRDKDTKQPIEGGEGQIFGNNQDRQSAWDSFTPGPELGTYYATVRFITAGQWAMAIRFRRDSTKPLERMDWMQEVRNARGPGS
jgi:hypothetical protein